MKTMIKQDLEKRHPVDRECAKAKINDCQAGRISIDELTDWLKLQIPYSEEEDEYWWAVNDLDDMATICKDNEDSRNLWISTAETHSVYYWLFELGTCDEK